MGGKLLGASADPIRQHGHGPCAREEDPHCAASEVIQTQGEWDQDQQKVLQHGAFPLVMGIPKAAAREAVSSDSWNTSIQGWRFERVGGRAAAVIARPSGERRRSILAQIETLREP